MPATMLLADDSSTIRRVIELTLANEDVRLVSVGDGESAILQIEADRPDIVLADVGMQKLDGYGVASHLKRSPALRDIPVLLLTGAFEPIDEARARASGCDGILVKPFDPQLLLARVKELLAGRPRGAAQPEGVFHAAPEVLSPVASPARTPAVLPVAPAAVQDAEFARRLDVEAPVSRDLDPGHVSLQTADEGGLELEFDQIEAAFAQRHQHDIPDLPRGETFIDEAPGMPVDGPSASLDGLGRRDVPAPPKADGLERSQPASPTAVSAALREPPAGPARNPRLLSRVSLADAFSALLAAEQAPPAPSSTAGSPAISEAMVEELVRRVLTRMTEDAVHRFVAETAERVLREELDRLKKDPH